jgi:rubredoxin
MKMHTGEKQYRCSVCGKRFNQKGSLEKHYTLHTVERQYGCGLLGKTFRCKLDLNQHTKLHKGGAHMCTVCGKVFTVHGNLDSHMRTHSGEKPYLCHTFGVHCTQKGALTEHPGYLPMIVSTSIQCVRNVLSLKVHLAFILWFTLVTNHTHVQHVRSLSLSEGNLCNILWYTVVKRVFCVWSVRRYSLVRSVWRDTWDCTLVRNLSTVIVVRVSLWNVIWKDILKDCMK